MRAGPVRILGLKCVSVCVPIRPVTFSLLCFALSCQKFYFVAGAYPQGMPPTCHHTNSLTGGYLHTVSEFVSARLCNLPCENRGHLSLIPPFRAEQREEGARCSLHYTRALSHTLSRAMARMTSDRNVRRLEVPDRAGHRRAGGIAIGP